MALPICAIGLLNLAIGSQYTSAHDQTRSRAVRRTRSHRALSSSAFLFFLPSPVKKYEGHYTFRSHMDALRLTTPTSFSAFPFLPYEIQLDLMRHLYENIESRRVTIVESPTGTVSNC